MVSIFGLNSLLSSLLYHAVCEVSDGHLVSCAGLQDVEKEKELRTQLSREEISHKVELYNSAVRDHLKMTLVSTLVPELWVSKPAECVGVKASSDPRASRN